MRIKRFLFIVLVTILYGCQSETLPTEVRQIETETPTPLSIAPTASRIPEEWILWSQSAHANTGTAEAVSNTYCAQCHSPLNWNPEAGKDKSVTVSAGEWRNVPCEVCHATNSGQFSSSVSWWNAVTAQNEPISDSTDLCEKCHRDTDEFHYKVELDTSVHAGFGCVTCHNPHSTAASCSNSGCHEQIRPESSIPPSTPTGGLHPNNASFCGGANCHPAATQAASSNSSIHGATHASVSCIACHDSSGLEAAPSHELGYWVTFQTLDKDGVQTKTPYGSHQIQRTVDCSRCHFEGNQWGLPLVSGSEFQP